MSDTISPENGRTTGYGYNELNQHNAATAPDQTDVAGVLARPAGEAVAVSVNGLPATVDRIADPSFSALSSPLSAGAEGLAWHRLGLPLIQGDNPFVVQASTASGQRVAQTNVVSVAAAPVFGYDGNGNMTTDGRFTYSWNDEDRLVSAVPVALTNGARKVEHVYDWMGRRILRTVSKLENNAWSPDNQTRYVYQDWNVIWETITHAQAPQETNRYFWGLDLSGTVQGAGGVGGLLATQISPLLVGEGQGEGGVYFAFYDGNGNVIQCTDAMGDLVVCFEYNPEGKKTDKYFGQTGRPNHKLEYSLEVGTADGPGAQDKTKMAALMINIAEEDVQRPADTTAGVKISPEPVPNEPVVSGFCGAFGVYIYWMLDREDGPTGYIYQKLDRPKVEATDCNGVDITGQAVFKEKMASLDIYPFYEAFEVGKHKTTDQNHPDFKRYDDVFRDALGFGCCSKGTVKLTAQAEFIAGPLRPGFEKRNGWPSGKLPASKTGPDFKNPIKRTVEVTWDCCPCEGKDENGHPKSQLSRSKVAVSNEK